MASHYSEQRLEWWSAFIDLFCFFLYIYYFFLCWAFSPLFRHGSIAHLHPGSRWSWQRLILFVFFCLSGHRPERWSSVFPFDGKKRTCIWGKPPTKYRCGIDCSKLPTQCVLRCRLTLWGGEEKHLPVKYSTNIGEGQGGSLEHLQTSESRTLYMCMTLWHCRVPDQSWKGTQDMEGHTDVAYERWLHVSPFWCAPTCSDWETLGGAGLHCECRGDKCNCSIMDPPEVWVWRVFSRRAGGRIHQEPLI